VVKFIDVILYHVVLGSSRQVRKDYNMAFDEHLNFAKERLLDLLREQMESPNVEWKGSGIISNALRKMHRIITDTAKSYRFMYA
jgi:hypothetical protein